MPVLFAKGYRSILYARKKEKQRKKGKRGPVSVPKESRTKKNGNREAQPPALQIKFLTQVKRRGISLYNGIYFRLQTDEETIGCMFLIQWKKAKMNSSTKG
ncbi:MULTISPECIES: hypothetical protein [Niallia]|uniref:hypothetical protein n=1 Tax=Niallia TaxID=2837506 RepID=UPI0026EC81BF|nr:hypothetical protein [Niallia circulans]